MSKIDEMIEQQKEWEKNEPKYPSLKLTGDDDAVTLALSISSVIITQQPKYRGLQEINLSIEDARKLYIWLKPLFETNDEDKKS